MAKPLLPVVLPHKCFCPCRDSYDCYRNRYLMRDASDGYVRAIGGPCDCSCHESKIASESCEAIYFRCSGEGGHAQLAGLKREDNPYGDTASEMKKDAWDDGWCAQDYDELRIKYDAAVAVVNQARKSYDIVEYPTDGGALRRLIEEFDKLTREGQ